jgi:bifunctional UDP-N-acetylglucosamine pyrophosphorylase / glucosamine-1-phosphate N-acetyltransferase
VTTGKSKEAGQAAELPGVILAAGKGTRMKGAESPKAAVKVGGRPMAARVIDAMKGAGAARVVVVIGHRAEDVQAAVGDHVEYVVQEEQLGTGHAVLQTEGALRGYEGPVLVTYADIPLLRSKDLRTLLALHRKSGAAVTLLTAVVDQPGTRGRILRNGDGSVKGIVEAKDATPEQLDIKEINVGVYCFQAPLLFEVLKQVTNHNAQQQYYLTDAIEILVRAKARVEAVAMESAHTGIGVDTPDDLARAQRILTMNEA